VTLPGNGKSQESEDEKAGRVKHLIWGKEMEKTNEVRKGQQGTQKKNARTERTPGGHAHSLALG